MFFLERWSNFNETSEILNSTSIDFVKLRTSMNIQKLIKWHVASSMSDEQNSVFKSYADHLRAKNVGSWSFSNEKFDQVQWVCRIVDKIAKSLVNDITWNWHINEAILLVFLDLGYKISVLLGNG